MGDSEILGSADVDTPGQRKRTEFAGQQRKNAEAWRKGGMCFMAKDYTGRIGQTGSQVVKAPAQLTPKKSGGKVKKGDDLRVRQK